MNPYADMPWKSRWPKRVPAAFEVPDVSCADVFVESARLFQNRPALIYFDTVFSYGMLDDLSSRFMAVLQELKINKGDRVALYMQNLPAYIIAEYGCWKNGSVVVPMNPMLKEREIEYLINDCSARLIVCEESLFATVENVLDRTPSIERIMTASPLDWYAWTGKMPLFMQNVAKKVPEGATDFREAVEKTPCGERPASVRSRDLAAISYTSGTTGVPKGALTSHRNHIANALNNALWFSLGCSDVFFGFVPWFHMTGANMQTVLPFFVGGAVVSGYRFDPGLALEAIEKHRITHGVGPITMFIAMLNHPEFKKFDLSCIRTLISGGAPVPEAVVNRWEKEAGSYIYNVMGLTESTAPLIFTPPGQRAPVDPETGALSIGIPLPNTELKVVDPVEGSRIVPLGEAGEMLVRGPMMVEGYWNKPEETSLTFSDGWCYTGDIVKMDEDGWVYLVDRKKDMIIASGFKVWPREVEDVLYSHPATREALVVGVPDAYRGETPKAFVSLKEEYKGKISREDFLQFCRKHLAAYKIPSDIEFLDEVPKTASGKVLRRVMREQELKKAGKTP